MRKLKVDKNDCSFINKETFEETLFKARILGKSILSNYKQLGITVFSIGTLFISGHALFGVGKSIYSTIDTLIKTINSEEPSALEHNDELFRKLLPDTVLIANVDKTVEADYALIDGIVYHKDGSPVDLTGSNKRVCLIRINIDRDTLRNMRFKESNTVEASFQYSSIQDDFIEELPSSLEVLNLSDCRYLKSLSHLKEKCPNLKRLCLDRVPLLDDFSFLYEFSFLEEVNLSESAYVSMELLDYFKKSGIKTNVTVEDVLNARKVDEIIKEIIEPGMSSRDKIKAITLYVIDNIEYDLSTSKLSNKKPLSCVLDSNKGVCASYAYLTTILLNKANVNAMEIASENHGWNLVETDGKYYYLDPTNIDGSFFYNKLLEIMGLSRYYMISPGSTFATVMSNPNDDVTIIPLELLEDINRQLDEETIFEKYGSTIGNIAILLGYILEGVISALFIPNAIWSFKCIRDLKYDVESTYYDYNLEHIIDKNFRKNGKEMKMLPKK